MCGIVAYKGSGNAIQYIVNGLKKLEYRGYDSAGIACIDYDKKVRIIKQAGSVEDLKIPKTWKANIGIGHTRWATHGKACARNAHPHVSFDTEISLVHNGIIENYKELYSNLSSKYNFVSDTDSEVLLYLIYDTLARVNRDLYLAVQIVMEKIVGAGAFVVMNRANPDLLVCAKRGSSLCVGVGDKEYFIASDSVAFSEHTNNVLYIGDEYITKIEGNNIEHYNNNTKNTEQCNIEKVYNYTYEITKKNYSSYMLKEIYEQPTVLSECLLGRLDGYNVKFGGLDNYKSIFSRARRITILGCGSSWHSALLGKYYIEEIAGLAINVEYASEFRYRQPVIDRGDIVVGISQSGETADTLEALRMAKDAGAITVGICNIVNSEMSKLTECGIYTRCGIEVGVASTKAFMNQCLCLLLLSLWLDQTSHHTNLKKRQKIIDTIKTLPTLVSETISVCEDMRGLAEQCSYKNHCLFLGRRYNFPIALEGALKLKEISYIHAEGYPAAEMKHGPIALIDKNMPVIIIANHTEQYNKIVNSVKEIEARSGQVIAILNNLSDTKLAKYYNIHVPQCDDLLTPFVSVVPLQLFALFCAEVRGCNVDKPRNLAKSVTVE